MIKKIAHVTVTGLSSSELEINLQANPAGHLDLSLKDPSSGKDSKFSFAGFSQRRFYNGQREADTFSLLVRMSQVIERLIDGTDGIPGGQSAIDVLIEAKARIWADLMDAESPSLGCKIVRDDYIYRT